jgi:hypothetical protein
MQNTEEIWRQVDAQKDDFEALSDRVSRPTAPVREQSRVRGFRHRGAAPSWCPQQRNLGRAAPLRAQRRGRRRNTGNRTLPLDHAGWRLPRLGVDYPCVGFRVFHAAPFDGSCGTGLSADADARSLCLIQAGSVIRTSGLYGRRREELSLDEVERTRV